MNNIISSNQKSITESEAEKDSMVPYYSASKALPALGVQFQKIDPYIVVTGAAAGNSMTFKFPPGAGFMYDASLAFTCTNVVAGADLVNQPGYNIINQIDFLCMGQPILTYTGRAIKALVKTLPFAEQQFHNRYALTLNPTTELLAADTNPSFLTYTPLIASWLTSVEKCLLLNQIADLQLRVSFATQAEAGLAAPITAISGVLHCQTYMPKLSVYNQMLVNDWNKQLIMECFNTYTEIANMSSTTAVTDYVITCPFLVYRMHLMVQGVAGASAIAGTYPIQSVSVTIAGVPFITSTKPSRLMTKKAKDGIASSSLSTATFGDVTFDAQQITTIDFGVESTRHKNSGTAYMSELRGSRLSITNSAVAAQNDARLFIIFEYWNNISYTPSQGGGVLNVYQNS